MASESKGRVDFDALWDFNHPDSTEAEFRTLLPAARESGDPEYLAQLLTQIARAQGLQMKFDEAARTLDEAEALLTEAMPVARVRWLLERGRLLNSSKRREGSKPLFREAWDRAREARADGFAVDAAHMLGIVEPGDASAEWNRRAIEFAERSGDPAARRWLGSLYNNLGWFHHEKAEYDTALDLFVKARVEREAQGAKDLIQVAHWCVARAMRSLGRLEEALTIQRRLLAEHEAAGLSDGYVREELAECLLALERPEEARAHFAAALDLLSKDPWLQRDEPERLERLKSLGDVQEPPKAAP